MSSPTNLGFVLGVALIGGLFGLVAWRILTGQISLDYLLYGQRGSQERRYFSPGRAQLLFISLGAAAYYLFQVVHDPTRFPEIPTSWLIALGASHSIYLGGKARSMLFGRALFTHRSKQQ